MRLTAHRWFRSRLGLPAILLAAAAVAGAADLPGSVVEVAGLDVWIGLEAEGTPQAGDLVDISFTIPGGERLSIGTWRVVEVRGERVFAEVVSNTGRPAVGQQAVVRATAARAPVAPLQRNASPPPAPAPSAAARLPFEIRQHVDALFRADSRAMRAAARQLYRHYRNESAVQAAAERALLAGFRSRPEDGEHVDGMSWLCNILGVSGRTAYAPTLEEVAAEAPSEKLRKYAQKNLARLR